MSEMSEPIPTIPGQGELFSSRELEPMLRWHSLAIHVTDVPAEGHPNAVRSVYRQFSVKACDIRDALDILTSELGLTSPVVRFAYLLNPQWQARLETEHPGQIIVEETYQPPAGDDVLIF
jgi:hypothetical protein